jgi:hypothetical protein
MSANEPSADEPPPISELAAAAEVAWRNVMVAESQALQPDGCCSADTWRGHLCPYHEGYADGIDVALDRMRAIEEMMSGRRPPPDLLRGSAQSWEAIKAKRAAEAGDG